MSDHSNPCSKLSLSARTDCPLIDSEGGSVRFIVVEVEASRTAERAGIRPPLNLALVIDASGSMSGRPIEAAKDAATRLAERLREEDLLSVVSFDTRVHTHIAARSQTALGKEESQRAISRLYAGSSTNLSGGWLAGCEAVDQAMTDRPGMRNRVVLLSDGHANHGITDPGDLGRRAARLRDRGLYSSTVGIGESYSNHQLEAIAEHGGGRMHHAASPQEMADLVLGELEELGNTVAEGIEIFLELPHGVSASVVGDYASSRTPSGLTCALGSLVGGGRRRVVFRIECPRGELDDGLTVHAFARWRPAASEHVAHTPRERCEFLYGSSDACRRQRRDTSVAQHVATAWQLSVDRRAVKLNQDGFGEEARTLVERELEHFERHCRDLPDVETLLCRMRELGRHVGERRFDPMHAKERLVFARKAIRSEAEHRKGVLDDPFTL